MLHDGLLLRLVDSRLELEKTSTLISDLFPSREPIRDREANCYSYRFAVPSWSFQSAQSSRTTGRAVFVGVSVFATSR